MSIEKVVSLFTAREKQYQNVTNAILDSVPNFIEGAIISMDLDTNEIVDWKEATIAESGIMSIVGLVSYKIGETLISEMGEATTITEENYNNFVRIIRVGIPIELAVDGTAEEIVEFLDEANAFRQHADDDEIQSFAEAIDGIIEGDVQEVEGTETLELSNEFNTNDLTDEQISSMLDNEYASKGKIH